jgi:murein peptide amidase A
MFGAVVALAAGVLLGHSVQGRPLPAVIAGDPAAPRRALVVGCIHGNECAGEAVIDRLRRLRPPRGVALWLVRSANPDGQARGTRENARGVDLNRNFPFRWQPLASHGPRPLSEPESQAMHRLILRVHPTVTIWYHQHLRLVDDSGGDPGIEDAYARAVGLPFRCLPRYPGSATSWQNHALPGATAFVVELPAGPLSAASANRHARAVLVAAAGATDGAHSACR